AVRLFRDDTSLSATPGLWPTIESALNESRYFILLASRDAASSKWVNKEGSHWLAHKSADTLLIGLTEGELIWDDGLCDFARNEVLPPALVQKFPAEPKWVDLRVYRDGAGTGNAKFTELAADFCRNPRHAEGGSPLGGSAPAAARFNARLELSRIAA